MVTETNRSHATQTSASSSFRARYLNAPAVNLTVLIVGIALIVAACDRAPQESVRIGYLPIYVDLPLFVAEQEGFFAKRGVKVELVRFAQSPDIATALNTGDVKVGASVAYSVVLSNEVRDPGKLRIVIVDSEDETNYLSSFVALPSSGIKALADLRGKKVGSFPGPQAMTFSRLVLEKAGLTPGKDLQLIELQSASHISALQSQTVDALFTYEPISTQAVLELGAVKFLPAAVESMIISPWQAGVWVVSTQFQQEHPQETQAIVLALYDAIDFMRRDPSAAKNALTEYTSINPAVADATPNIPFAKLGEIDMAALQRHADILRQAGVISMTVIAKDLLAPTSWISDQQQP